MMKINGRWRALGACLVGLALMVGCGGSQAQWGATTWSRESTNKLKVLSTTAMINDIVSQIGGEEVEAITLIFGQLNPHAYQLVKGDDEKLNQADLIFCSGLNLEHGASLKEYLSTHKKVVALGDTIAKGHPELILHVDEELDPHIWMDILLWARIAPIIAETLAEKDPLHASLYRERAVRVEEEMAFAHRKIQEEMHSVPANRRYLVTSHDAFNYFTRAYLAEDSELEHEQWRERCVAPEGLAPDGQISATDIRKVIDHLAKYHITVLFPESNVNKDSLKKIVEAGQEIGLSVHLCNAQLYGDAMGAKDSEGGAYLGMIRHNATTIKTCWEEYAPE